MSTAGAWNVVGRAPYNNYTGIIPTPHHLCYLLREGEKEGGEGAREGWREGGRDGKEPGGARNKGKTFATAVRQNLS